MKIRELVSEWTRQFAVFALAKPASNQSPLNSAYSRLMFSFLPAHDVVLLTPRSTIMTRTFF
jgi:hypothetical protein